MTGRVKSRAGGRIATSSLTRQNRRAVFLCFLSVRYHGVTYRYVKITTAEIQASN